MAANKKVSDEQIIEKLRDPKLSFKEVAESLGVAWAGTFNNRCRRLVEKYSLPDRIYKNPGRPKRGSGKLVPIDVEPFVGKRKTYSKR